MALCTNIPLNERKTCNERKTEKKRPNGMGRRCFVRGFVKKRAFSAFMHWRWERKTQNEASFYLWTLIEKVGYLFREKKGKI
jgi:hypothetical protein